MNQPNKAIIATVTFLSIFLTSCKKDWLEEKPDITLATPSTINDFVAMFDNTAGFGVTFNNDDPALGEIGAADFDVTDNTYGGRQPIERLAYIWASDIFGTVEGIKDWNDPYERIFYSNIVLNGIDKITPKNPKEQSDWNQAKGSAYFFRGYNHYWISQLFCKPYEETSSKTDLGIPLRLEADVNIKSSRSSVEETYRQIINDLNEAAKFLPISAPAFTDPKSKCRPTKTAAHAMLARVYLLMGNYDSTILHADKTLALYDTLLNYNHPPVDTIINTPFQRFNPEVIFQNLLITYSIISANNGIVRSSLYNSYDLNDLRRRVFFRTQAGRLLFKGSYDGSGTKFSGLATDEVYLIRAEAYARQGNASAAITDLNTLLVKRFRVGTYVPYTTTNPAEALSLIINERRKELCFRGLRWSDLRRLNKEPAFAVTLNRTVQTNPYTLAPLDNKYVLPIPPEVLALTGIQQNPR